TPYHALSLFLDVGRLFGISFETNLSSYSFLHPKLQVELLHKGEKFGFLGQLNPRITQILGIKGDVFVGELKMALIKESKKRYKPFSKFPPVIRDLSLVIDKDTPVDKLIFHMKDMLKEKLEEVKVFSIYTGSDVGEGKKSVSFRLVFRSFEGTMSDEEANDAVKALVSSLEESFGARLR
ncbi:MAG: phenylalanine--tRNA ligase subunit beta, partial [Hydrogenobacter sp.]